MASSQRPLNVKYDCTCMSFSFALLNSVAPRAQAAALCRAAMSSLFICSMVFPPFRSGQFDDLGVLEDRDVVIGGRLGLGVEPQAGRDLLLRYRYAVLLAAQASMLRPKAWRRNRQGGPASRPRPCPPRSP